MLLSGRPKTGIFRIHVVRIERLGEHKHGGRYHHVERLEERFDRYSRADEEDIWWPKADTSEARFLTVEEVNRLGAVLSAQPPYDLLVRFGALTGLRIGEVAALRVRDIDLRRGEAQVRRNMTHTSKCYHVGTPRTARAVNDAPIPDETLFRDLGAYLRDHRHRDDLEAGL